MDRQSHEGFRADLANVLTPTSVSELQRNLYLQARSHPNGQLHDLYPLVWREDVLQQAYLLCRARNTHAPGVDGKRLVDIATYGARKWLKELEHDLQGQTYQPSPLLQTIPSDSGQTARILVIPTIRDEVCMTATMIVIEPIAATWAGTSLRSAPTNAAHGSFESDWKAVLERSVWHRDQSDVPGWDDYLSTVPHSALKLSLALRIVDQGLLDLFALWLACPIISGDNGQRPTSAPAPADRCGIPANLPISPLLMHLAMPKFAQANKDTQNRRADRASLLPNLGKPNGGHSSPAKELYAGQPLRSPWRDQRLRYAMAISMLLHALVISMQFGEPGYGIPLWGQQVSAQSPELPRVNVVLASPMPPLPDPSDPPPVIVDAASPPVASVTVATIRPKQINEKALAPARPVLASKQRRSITGVKSPVAKRKSTKEVPKAVATATDVARPTPIAPIPVLTTPVESTWSTPVSSATSNVTELIKNSPIAEEIIVEKASEQAQPDLQAQAEAEKAQRARAQIDLEQREETRRQHEAVIEQVRRKQAAAAKAAEDARLEAELARQRRAKETALAAEAAVAAQALAQARAESERVRQLQEAKAAEDKLKQAQAEAEANARALAEQEAAVAKLQREERARVEAEKLKIAQAKAKEEELQRTEAERLRQTEIQRAKEALQERERNEAIAKREAEKAAEAEKAQRAIEARAAAEKLAKQAQAEAEAQARQRAAEAAAQAKKLEAERALAAEQAIAAQARIAQAAAAQLSSASSNNPAGSLPSPSAGGSRDAGTGSTLPSGRELAARSLDSARNSPSSVIPIAPLDAQSPRRASILGRDPKDIQLAFYGDGWRQKVERVGAMNFPKLSKFLTYDPMVVTVSINSDGTLAGIRIVKSSGHIDLDNAVRRIIEMSAPFAAFPPSLKRNFDVADITRTWVFIGDRPQLSGD